LQQLSELQRISPGTVQIREHRRRGGRFRICDVIHVASLTLGLFGHRFVPIRFSHEPLETAIAALARQGQ